MAIVAASNTRAAPRGVALGLAGAALLVALYALGGKIVPGLHIGAFDLNPGDEFSRVREPIGYWNAVGILCVMAAPVCIWLAASPDAGAAAADRGAAGADRVSSSPPRPPTRAARCSPTSPCWR